MVSCLVHFISLLPCLLLVQKCFSLGLCTLQGSSHTEALSSLPFPIPTPKVKHPRACENMGKILLCGALTGRQNFFKKI